jgi:hypothetical protein
MKKLFILIIAHGILCCAYALNIPEKVYIATDREMYITGEPILFKLNLLSSSTQRTSELSKIAYVVIRNEKSESILKLRICIDKGEAIGYISLPDTLNSGLYQLVVFTNLMRNYGEESYFRKELMIVNQSDKEYDFNKIKFQPATVQSSLPVNQLKISCDSPHYVPGQKVKVKLSHIPSGANVTVSVFESPNQCICAQTLMADTLINQSEFGKTYLHEIKGTILNGEVIDEITHQKIKAAVVLVSCVDTIPNLQYAITDSDGSFHVFLSNYYDGKEVFLTIKDVPENSNRKIKVEDKFTLSKKFTPLPIMYPGDNFIAKSQNIVYVNKSYEIESYTQHKPKAIKQHQIPYFYHTAAKTLYPADYVSLNNFSEIITELFPMLSIKRHNDKTQIKVLGATSKQFEYKGPAVFLDGVYVDDTNKILELGSDVIKKIDVIYSERIFGDLVFQGMVSVTSKGNLIESMEPASYSLRIKNPAIHNTDFLTTNTIPITENKKKPFVKQLLYWNPSIKISDSEDTYIEFYTSDNLGNYTIKAEGILNNGKPICTTTNFEVKK